MGMLQQARGGRRRRRSEATIEMTPLIDITFQLLIFFLLTATFQDFSSLDVELAQAKNAEKREQKQSVLVSISEDGRVEIDRVIVDLRELELRLCKAQAEGSVAENIRADKGSRHESLVGAMDVAKRCGFESLGILHSQN